MTCNCPNMALVGNNKTYHVSHEKIRGNNLDVHGDNNEVIGNNNDIHGNNNRCIGNNLGVTGDGNVVTGNNCDTYGYYNVVRGNNSNSVITGGHHNSLGVDPTNLTEKSVETRSKRISSNNMKPSMDQWDELSKRIREDRVNKRIENNRKWKVNVKLNEEEYKELDEYMESVKYLWEIW